MTPHEALHTLDTAVASLQVNREQHVMLQNAVRVLLEAIEQPDQEPESNESES